MQKTPELIQYLNTLGVADVELKNNNVVKIHFQQGVSQKTWSKKELTDICNAFIAGMEASKLQPGFSEGGYKKKVDDFWGTVAAKPDLEPAPVGRLG